MSEISMNIKARHGPGATKATEICEYFGIDPEGTDFRKAESKEG